ncbi:hypothetical protein AG4045_027548 [Apium graveolens]|uniref:Uncharacterized protein n=1 Tax=Apium graveolens TaxID=4045 RepID=A0A6L5BAE7_APIGR|nr:hypothetical protein AG4045_027548 [Apium graveolens]
MVADIETILILDDKGLEVQTPYAASLLVVLPEKVLDKADIMTFYSEGYIYQKMYSSFKERSDKILYEMVKRIHLVVNKQSDVDRESDRSGIHSDGYGSESYDNSSGNDSDSGSDNKNEIIPPIDDKEDETTNTSDNHSSTSSGWDKVVKELRREREERKKREATDSTSTCEPTSTYASTANDYTTARKAYTIFKTQKDIREGKTTVEDITLSNCVDYESNASYYDSTSYHDYESNASYYDSTSYSTYDSLNKPTDVKDGNNDAVRTSLDQSDDSSGYGYGSSDESDGSSDDKTTSEMTDGTTSSGGNDSNNHNSNDSHNKEPFSRIKDLDDP